MVWFFDRDEESLRLETRYNNDSSEFVAIIRYSEAYRDPRRTFSVSQATRGCA